MRLGTLDVGGQRVSGVLDGADRFVPLSELAFRSVADFVSAEPHDRERRLAERAVEGLVGAELSADPMWQAPLHPPRNLFCIGTNYRSHFDEGDRPDDTLLPQEPVVFTKPWTTLIGHAENIRVPRGLSAKVDWEAEVAVVIGRGGRFIPQERALDHVFGYTLANDVSARDLQLRPGNLNQWFMGKTPDTFCPMGPWVTSADAVDFAEIEFTLDVNGVTKQHGRTTQLIFGVARLIATLSRVTALLPGDIILTGTPSGVGQWRDPQEFLLDADVVTISSPQLGTLRNQVRVEEPVYSGGH